MQQQLRKYQAAAVIVYKTESSEAAKSSEKIRLDFAGKSYSMLQ